MVFPGLFEVTCSPIVTWKKIIAVIDATFAVAKRLYGIRTLDLCDTCAALCYSSSSFHGFITNQFNDLLPVGLLAQLVERCTGIAEVKGSNPVQAWKFFSGFLFATAEVTSITAMVFFRISNSLPCSSHKWFSYIHNFKLSNTCEQRIKMVRRVWNSLCATTKSLDFHRKESGCHRPRKPCMICTCPSFKMATAGSLNPMVLCANYIIFSLESSIVWPTFCWPDIYFTVAFSLPPRNF